MDYKKNSIKLLDIAYRTKVGVATNNKRHQIARLPDISTKIEIIKPSTTLVKQDILSSLALIQKNENLMAKNKMLEEHMDVKQTIGKSKKKKSKKHRQGVSNKNEKLRTGVRQKNKLKKLENLEKEIDIQLEELKTLIDDIERYQEILFEKQTPIFFPK